MTMPVSVVVPSRPVVVAMAVGIVVGSGATWWLFSRRLTAALQRLAQQILDLRRDIDRLRSLVEERVLPREARRNDATEFADDDDDVYEDAYDGYQTCCHS